MSQKRPKFRPLGVEMSFQTRQLCGHASGSSIQGAGSPSARRSRTHGDAQRRPPPPAQRARPPTPRTQLQLQRPPASQAAHPQPAPDCVWLVHTHTHSHTVAPARGGRAAPGTAARPHGTRTARAAAAAARGFPARPRYDPAPHNTSRDTRTGPHRPHRVACTPLGPRLCILSHSRPHTFATPLPARCTLPQPSPPYWRSYWRSQGHPSWEGGGLTYGRPIRRAPHGRCATRQCSSTSSSCPWRSPASQRG